MARKLRIQYEGAIYHVMSRGNGKAAVFHNDVDRRSFVQALAEACAKTDWQVHAYCLMKTHFHLVVETPRSNLDSGDAVEAEHHRDHRLDRGPVTDGEGI